jgi:hypothetical protein
MACLSKPNGAVYKQIDFYAKVNVCLAIGHTEESMNYLHILT